MLSRHMTDYIIIDELERIMRKNIKLKGETGARFSLFEGGQLTPESLKANFNKHASNYMCCEDIQGKDSIFCVAPHPRAGPNELVQLLRKEYVELLKGVHPKWKESIEFLNTTGVVNKLLAINTGNCHSNYGLFCAYRLLWAAPHTVKMILFWNGTMDIPFHKCMLLLEGTRHLWDILGEKFDAWVYLATAEYLYSPADIKAHIVEEYTKEYEQGYCKFYSVIRKAAGKDRFTAREIAKYGRNYIPNYNCLFKHEFIYNFFQQLTTTAKFPTVEKMKLRNQRKD